MWTLRTHFNSLWDNLSGDTIMKVCLGCEYFIKLTQYCLKYYKVVDDSQEACGSYKDYEVVKEK